MAKIKQQTNKKIEQRATVKEDMTTPRSLGYSLQYYNAIMITVEAFLKKNRITITSNSAGCFIASKKWGDKKVLGKDWITIVKMWTHYSGRSNQELTFTGPMGHELHTFHYTEGVLPIIAMLKEIFKLKEA